MDGRTLTKKEEMRLPDTNWLITVDPKKSKDKRRRRKGLCHQNLFLTYPKCNLSLKDARIQLRAIFSNNGLEIVSYAMCCEQHIDKMYHLHCFFSLDKKFNDTSMAKLDLVDLNGHKYHGNYQAVRRKHNVIEYCLKSLEFIASEDIISNYFAGKYPEAVINQCCSLAEQGQPELAIKLYGRCIPVSKRLKIASVTKRIEQLGKLYAPTKKVAKYQIEDYCEHLGIIASVEQLDTKCLWIYGPPGTNKTQYTLSLLEQVYRYRILFVDNINVLNLFDPKKHQVIVFDDIDMRKLKREDLISLIDADVERTAKILYKTVTLPPETHRIVIANFHPEKLWNRWPKEYAPRIKRRLNIVKVTDSLLKSGDELRLDA